MCAGGCQGREQRERAACADHTLTSAGTDAIPLEESRTSSLSQHLLFNYQPLTFRRRQLGGDVHVAQVPLAALDSLVGRRGCFARHFPLFVDLEAAFLVNLSTVINAQGSKTLLALAAISVPTGHAFTHTFVEEQLRFIICKNGDSRGKNTILFLIASVTQR